MINNKYLLSALFAVACGTSTMAQEEAFDLTSQRGEKQDVNVVPGKKLDHQGIVVNPTPHNLEINRQNWISFENGLNIQDKQKRFADDLAFLKQLSPYHRLRREAGKESRLEEIGIGSLSPHRQWQGHKHRGL